MENPKHTPSSSLALLSVWETRVACACFLALGVAVAMAWTACRAGISFFSGMWLNQYFVFMQIAYNAPALPVLIISATLDHACDARMGSSRAFATRLTVAMLAMVMCLAVLPFGSSVVCLCVMSVIGVADAVAYGTASSFFSLFPASVSGYYFIGASLTSVLSIALTFATGFSSSPPTLASACGMYFSAAGLVLAGLACTLYLLRSAAGRKALADKDAGDCAALPEPDNVKNCVTAVASGDDLKAALLVPPPSVLGSSDEVSPSLNDSGAPAPVAPVGSWAIVRATGVVHVTLLLCWTGTGLVDALITFVPSQHDGLAGATREPDMSFRMWALYASLLGELAGKWLNIVAGGRVMLLRSPRALLACAALRCGAAALFVAYVLQPDLVSASAPASAAPSLSTLYLFRLDGLYLAFQAAFDAVGSLTSSACYDAAPALLPSPALRARSSLLLGVTLTAGIYAGLAGSYALLHVLNGMPGSDAGSATPGG